MSMLSSKQTRWLAGLPLFAGLLCLVILSANSSSRSVSRNASASFLGFTNVAGKGRCAMIAFTNTSNMGLALLVDSFETPVSNVWTRNPMVIGRTVTPQALTWLASFSGWRDDVRPGDGFVAFVPVPVTNASWRICFIAQEREPQDAWRDIFGTATPNSTVFLANRSRPIAGLFKYHTYSGRRYTFTSPDVSASE